MESRKDNIKILSETIRKNGFKYILLSRTPKKAIYKQTLDNVQVGFEVFLIRVLGAQFSPLLKNSLDAYEKFPRNSDVGKTARTFQYYEAALSKYQEL
jgi:hypothetical protein